jgi:hypothetical protein
MNAVWQRIGCTLATIAVVVLVVFVNRGAGPWREYREYQGLCQNEMATVWAAIDKYHGEKGRYPANLDELVPGYLPSERSLHLSKKPNGPRFTYYVPPKGAPKTAVILEYRFDFVSFMGERSVAILRRKNGDPGMKNIRGHDFNM